MHLIFTFSILIDMSLFRMDLQLMAMGKPEDDAIVFNNPKGKENCKFNYISISIQYLLSTFNSYLDITRGKGTLFRSIQNTCR